MGMPVGDAGPKSMFGTETKPPTKGRIQKRLTTQNVSAVSLHPGHANLMFHGPVVPTISR